MLTAWRQPRLWLTLLWSLTLACGFAGWDWLERRFESQAAVQPVMLLPERDLAPAERDAAARQFRGEAGVLSVRWVAPADLARDLTRRYADQPWRQLLPASGGGQNAEWLPWMMEVWPVSPIDGIGAIEAFIARRKQEGGWQAMWDGDTPRRVRAARAQTRGALGMALLLAGLLGAGGLLTQPWPRLGWGLWAWSAALGIAAPGGAVAAAWLAGAPIDARSAAIAMGGGFLIAGGIAPMLRLRRSARLDITLGEDSHERP